MAVLRIDFVVDCMQIPWRSLGQSPVVVELDSIYVLACPKTGADAEAASAAGDGEVIARSPAVAHQGHRLCIPTGSACSAGAAEALTGRP